MFRRPLLILVVAVMAVGLVACGKKGTPMPRGDSDFPRIYPNPSKYPPVSVPAGTSSRTPSPEQAAPARIDDNEDDLGINAGRMSR